MGDNKSPLDQKQTVIVTGFGPFANHPVNASWECVKELKSIGLGESVDLVIEEIPVEYSYVKKGVPDLWNKHNPVLMIHVGVSGIAKDITLEQQGHNEGYDKDDVKGCKADDLCCVSGADSVITSELDMKCVCDAVNESGTKAKAIISHDAGRYLCDYTYFTSLHRDKRRTAFIHIPQLNKPYTVQELAAGVKVAILSMLDQVNKHSEKLS